MLKEASCVLKAVMAGALTVLLLSGCGSTTSGKVHSEGSSSSVSFAQEKSSAERVESLKELFQSELDQQGDQLDAFERDVFTRAAKSGHMEQSDYESAHDKYMECMANAGYTERDTKMPDGVYKSADTVDPNMNVDAWFKQSNKCSEHTTKEIEAAFREQQDNPERYKDSSIIAAQCLIDAKIVDKSYTAAKFKEAADTLNSHQYKGALRDLFGFPVDGQQGAQARFCLSLGSVEFTGSDDVQ
ncbi:hypothetical protein [Bifidobacterium bombi]|uniref:Lipoprotein n=1 Tax=Bifidobacterium bombi DSM 19703 TaxID=1341695 RepID=A0A080N686_9BIFI|nr:hypothetical protein [Bifidobacterium bombi]KFF31369.1 hypothetical protein BBOMB_0717 [Bifidobacterium bombi DSM 19703]